MACKITITSVNVYGPPGQPVTSVTVEGTAEECNQNNVVVGIGCGGTEKTISVTANPLVTPPQWKAVFSDLTGTGCICGSGVMRVTAKCKADQNCPPAIPWTLTPPQCLPPENDCCPTVSVEVTEGDCNADGRRNVTFLVSTTPATGPGCPETVFAQIDFGDGMLGAGFVVPPSSVWQETHPYVPGSYTAKVHLIAPSGCPDIPVKVGPLVACPPGCPDPDDITVAIDDCDADGRRIVSVNVLLPGSGSTTVSVDWQDGTTPDSNLPIQGGVLWTGWHHYLPPGPYKVKVSVAGCPPITKPVGPLETCDGGNGNGNGDDHGCPPWWPFCKGWNFCALLLALALASILGGAVAVIVAACNPYTIATPHVLILVMLASLAQAVLFLFAWYKVCAKLDVGFCDTLDQLIQLLFGWVIVGQPSVLAILALFAVFGWNIGGACWLGAFLSWGYFALILTYLYQIRSWAHCTGHPPTHY